LPSLRQRSENIPELVEIFFERSSNEHGRSYLRLPEALLDRFLVYQWPGNIRELENTQRIRVKSARFRRTDEEI
jgi:DNA-binding NtrC family response regulator